MDKIDKYLEKVNNKIAFDKAKLKGEKAKNDLLREKRVGFKLELENKSDSNIKRWGYILGLYTIFGFIASTSISIAGGINNFEGIKVPAFILFTIFIQTGIIIFSIKESAIRRTKHYTTMKMIQYSLILLSIYFNWEFFSAKSGWILLLCIIIELTVIKSAAIGGDFRSLTFKTDLDQDENVRPSIIKIVLYNLFFKFVNRQVELYNENKAAETPVKSISLTSKTEVRQKLEPKLDNKILLLEESKTELENVRPDLENVRPMLDYESIKKYLLDHYNDNECIIGLKNKFGLELTDYRNLMEKLKNDGVTYTSNKKTYLKPQSKLREA